MRILLLLMLLPLSSVFAASIEATGQAIISNGDIEDARQRAIGRATEQASLLAMAQIATTQSIRDGILEIDNLRVNTLATLGKVELIDERRTGNRLEVLIRAQITAEQGCGDTQKGTAYRKPVGITQWRFKRPADANLGRLHMLSQALPAYLLEQMESVIHLKPIDATQHQFPSYSALSPDADRARAEAASNISAQYILSAEIETLAMANPRGDTPNVLIDLVEKTGLKKADNERLFRLSADLIDTQSGALLQRYALQTSGDWEADLQRGQSMSLDRFWQQPFGEAVKGELDQLITQLADSLACQPLTANILSAEQDKIWIDRGSDAGINPGDRLSVARQMQLYNDQMQPYTKTEPTQLSLLIERTEFNRSLGRLSQPAETAGIQPGDLVIGH